MCSKDTMRLGVQERRHLQFGGTGLVQMVDQDDVRKSIQISGREHILGIFWIVTGRAGVAGRLDRHTCQDSVNGLWMVPMGKILINDLSSSIQLF